MNAPALLALLVVLLSPNTAHAMPFTDIPEDAWYGDAVTEFVNSGYLFTDTELFRGNEQATRAEFLKLIVELNGGILSTPDELHFSDVPKNAWYYGYFEEAGIEGWVRGDGDCYGTLPCYARPNAGISRAEAASLIVRAFGLMPTSEAKLFVDNEEDEWYYEAIQTAADHCILAGDDLTGKVRPSDNMNRAEMVAMLQRADRGLVWGMDCGPVNTQEPDNTKTIESTQYHLSFPEASVSLDIDIPNGAPDVGGILTLTCSGEISSSMLSPNKEWIALSIHGAAHDCGWLFHIPSETLYPAVAEYASGVKVEDWSDDSRFVTFIVTSPKPESRPVTIDITSL